MIYLLQLHADDTSMEMKRQITGKKYFTPNTQNRSHEFSQRRPVNKISSILPTKTESWFRNKVLLFSCMVSSASLDRIPFHLKRILWQKHAWNHCRWTDCMAVLVLTSPTQVPTKSQAGKNLVTLPLSLKSFYVVEQANLSTETKGKVLIRNYEKWLLLWKQSNKKKKTTQQP